MNSNIYHQPQSPLDMDDNKDSTLNPWISIWTKPKLTIAQIVKSDPEKMVPLLAMLAGITQVLSRASSRSSGDQIELAYILLLAGIMGPISGVISLFLVSALISWTGKWIGGAAPQVNIRAAYAWSGIPSICMLVLWLPELILFGQELFTSETLHLDANAFLSYVYMGFGVVEIVLFVWGFILFLACLSQVQGYSVWKALLNVLFIFLLFLAFIAGIVLIILGFKALL